EKGFYRLMDAINILDELKTGATSTFNIREWKQGCYDAMNDDFNSPMVIANLFEAVKFINQIKDGSASITKEDLDLIKKTIFEFTFDILGLVNVTKAAESTTDKLTSAVELLIQLRQEARANKDFAMSDKIRDELASKGIQLNDGKEGTTFSLS
ncbi:MAG: DALR domain-containing protein, partial [Aquaticitalea sp.]